MIAGVCRLVTAQQAATVAGPAISYGIACFLGLKLAFRGLNGLSFHNPGAFWALLSLPRGHLRSNTRYYARGAAPRPAQATSELGRPVAASPS